MTRALAAGVRAVADADAARALVWIPPAPVRAIASGPLGGGLGTRAWVLNASVAADYARLDPDVHLRALARELGLGGVGAGVGVGVGMLTAVDVAEACWSDDQGAEALVTVGLGWPTWAAAADGAPNPYAGTINIVAWVPEPLDDAALVGAVGTVTEAKAQALLDAGVPGTGTASDAVCVCCPLPRPARAPEPFAGVRSRWGARVARAVHAAVAAGIP